MAEHLDADDRTIHNLLDRGGIVPADGAVPSLEEFMCGQKFIANPFVLIAVMRFVNRDV